MSRLASWQRFRIYLLGQGLRKGHVIEVGPRCVDYPSQMKSYIGPTDILDPGLGAPSYTLAPKWIDFQVQTSLEEARAQAR